MSLTDRILDPGPKKLLAIDGGGIRGMLALGILEKIESVLRKRCAGDSQDFRLAQYFDYIAGTSTGGIIAAALSVGMSVQEIIELYREAGPQMFVKTHLWSRLRSLYKHEPLEMILKARFGVDTKLGSEKVATLLLLVMRNATTDSPWPISNNPYAKYNERSRIDCNLDFPLWQLVRASTAAPVYFPPEVIVLPAKKDKEFIFVDGGITTYNNPAFQMFIMATLDQYWQLKKEARWRTGRDKMMIVSVGTGTAPDVQQSLDPDKMNVLFNARTIPSALMFAALNEQDLLCRVFGDCRAGEALDREIGTLGPCDGPLDTADKLFTYMRYNAELTREGLDKLGLNTVDPERVQKLDSIAGIDDLLSVGRRVGAVKVLDAHFDGFVK